jgi:N-acetylmuramoyl-L-alanine amidase
LGWAEGEHDPGRRPGFNRGMIAIAYVGGMGPDGKPKDTRTVKQKEALAKLVQLLAVKHGLPETAIWGHRDWDHKNKARDGHVGHLDDVKKMCPCFEVSEERAAWMRGEVA